MSENPAQLPSKQEFLGASNTVFEANDGEGNKFEISLVSVDEIVSNEFQENFSLLFRAGTDAGVQQGIYHLRHKDLGAMDLFLVPVKKDETGLYLEAVFNLIKAAGA